IHHVCMISCLHGLYDDRIYWKEALSLKRNGYDVTHIGVGVESKDFVSEHGIRLVQVKRKQYFRDPYIDKILRFLLFRPSLYLQILDVAAGIKADIYHFHDIQINKIGRKLKNLSHQPKVIYDVHEPYPEVFRYAPASNPVVRMIQYLFSVHIRHRELRCSESYDMVIATEENVAKKFKDYLCTDNKVDIIYNYTNLHPETTDYPSENKVYDAIYAGSIRSTRGIYQMIHATRIARDKGYSFRILFIGPVFEKNLKRKISWLLTKYQLTQNFMLKEPVSYELIGKFYKQSKAGLIIFNDNPVNRTILPIKLFEYMAYGLPVLCSNFGHMKNYTEAEKTGMTINPANPEDICDKLITLLTDNDLYIKCSSNGINAVAQRYSWQFMEPRLLSIYQRLLH
ncbi:MAG TPA: glycosyltransferase family 4 protein, partial [Bacteroidales bacterium]|nr:glycosyltransferase family 4 protein [Bacteroidales bacterium]